MKLQSFIRILLVSLLAAPSAAAQDVISFDPRGLVLGIDLGAATYDGDEATAFGEFNTGLGFEAYYNLSRRLSAGLSFSSSRYGIFDESRNSLGLGVRLRMLSDRVSPYLGLGANIVNGGEKTGLGPAASLGIEVALADRAAIFVEGAWKGSSPDDAVDNATGDSGIDHLLHVGAGVRFRLTQPKNPRFAVEIEAPDTVLVGDISVLRARVTGNPSSEVYLSWDMDQVSSYRGEEVRHVFEYLGPQTITVSGRNKRYEVRASSQVVVVEDESYRNLDDPLLSAQPSTEGRVRIIEIYGSRTPTVGEELNYRVRLQPGAVWPVNYLWDMGDGTSLLGNNVLQRYDEPGTYTVAIVARNRLGADTLTTLVEVRPRQGRMEEPAEVVEDVASGDPGSVAPPRARYRPEELRSMKAVSRTEGGYGWVVGSYLDRESAESLMRQFRVKGFRTGIVIDSRPGASTAYRVVVGQFSSTAGALSAKREIQRLVATPITILDIANPSVAVGARVTPQQRPSEPRPPAERARVDEPPATVRERARTPETDERPDTVRSGLPEDDLLRETRQAAESGRSREAAVSAIPTPQDLRDDAPGPQIRSLKVYVRDERLLLFIDGVSDRDYGISRAEYRVVSAEGEQLSNWTEVSLVPPGRSSYGLQMHRVPVPQGLSTDGGTVEVRVVNSAGGFTTLSSEIGTE